MMRRLRHILLLTGALFVFLSIVCDNDSVSVSAKKVTPATIDMVQSCDDHAEIHTARRANSLFRTPRTIAVVWSAGVSFARDTTPMEHTSAKIDARVWCASLESIGRRVESRRSLDRIIILHNLRV
ncbi:MAG: hypothetical protein J6V43_04475 [Rikenellaceae bacterium]|nr:hypothetical protein [Rikenellaceae bacterium]